VAADGGASIGGCGQSAGGRVTFTTGRPTVRPANAAHGLDMADYGKLGNGNTNNSTLPVAVGTSGVPAAQSLTKIAENTWDACAVSQAGTAYCCFGHAAAYGQIDARHDGAANGLARLLRCSARRSQG
jgi:hypothetical protein